MKRLIAALLCFCLLFGLIGCASPAEDADAPTPEATAPAETPAPEGVYTPGTYEGTARGYGGDVTVTIQPNVAQKRDIINNMVDTLRYVEDEKPNIALLALVEQPSFHMKDTIEAYELVQEHNRKPIADCELVGPISYDLIMSKEAARLKSYDNPLCGEFDGIVAPSLLAGNLIVKGWQMHAHAKTCGVVIGAKIRCAITSRSDSPEVAFNSLAFCTILPAQCPYL